MPMAQAPAWCVYDFANKGNYYDGWYYICSDINRGEGIIPISSRLRLAPIVTSTLDTACLTFFLYLMWQKRTWRVQNSRHNFRFYCMIAIFVICVSDIFIANRLQNPPIIMNVLRPAVILLLLGQARNHFRNVMLLFYDSALLISMIFVFVGFYSFTGFFMFKNTLEGYTFFSTPGVALYEMFICLTTSNFPNVMLPAYYKNQWYCMYWVFFMCFGMYFLQNLLLASIFENYKLRVLKTAEDRLTSRDQLIESFFDFYDEENKGYLDLVQTKQFLAFLLDLNFRKFGDKIKFKKALSLIDPHGLHQAHKKDVILLFQNPDFMDEIST